MRSIWRRCGSWPSALLPTLAKNPVTSSNPNGEFLYGVGDAGVQAAIIHDLDQRFAVGFGARLITPTGGDTFGSGKWQVMPIVGVRYALWELSSSSYFEPVVRYDVSFAGDPTKKNISNLQMAQRRHQGEFRRPRHRPDRPAVSAVRFQGGTQV